jgi:hypothetical protein
MVLNGGSAGQGVCDLGRGVAGAVGARVGARPWTGGHSRLRRVCEPRNSVSRSQRSQPHPVQVIDQSFRQPGGVAAIRLRRCAQSCTSGGGWMKCSVQRGHRRPVRRRRHASQIEGGRVAPALRPGRSGREVRLRLCPVVRPTGCPSCASWPSGGCRCPCGLTGKGCPASPSSAATRLPAVSTEADLR